MYDWHHTDLPWADAALDARHKAGVSLGDALVAVQDLTDLVALTDRSVELGGWHVEAYLIPATIVSVTATGVVGAGTEDASGLRPKPMSLLVLTAPDGWRGAVVFDATEGRRFAWSAVPLMMPCLGRYLSNANMKPERRHLMGQMALAGFPMLRETITDPLSWSAEEMPDMGGEQTADLIEWMLSWASSGVKDEHANVLSDYKMEPVRTVNSWSAGDLVAWWKRGWTDPAVVVKWVQAGVRTPGSAEWFVKAGVDVDEAVAWSVTPVGPMRNSRALLAFKDAGWTPKAVQRLAAQVRAAGETQPLPPRHEREFFPLVARWRDLVHPSRASAYIEAGIGAEEAHGLEQANPPDPDALRVLAAFTAAISEDGILRDSSIGGYVSPYHLGHGPQGA